MTSPSEFLAAVLAPAGADALGWFTAFEVAPENAGKTHWNGRKCRPVDLPVINGANAYYSVAAFPSHAQARTGKEMLGTCVLLLDDVGTKGSADRAQHDLGEPSFKIQTSAQSQQWGYLLDRPAAEAEIAPVHARLLQMGLCDRNGRGPTRYGRLPAGINNKADYPEPFAVVCLDWRPERRFNLADIARRLGAVEAEPQQHDEGPFPQDEWEHLAALITTGERYHDALNSLAMKYAHSGVKRADVLYILRGHMLSTEDRSNRWRARFEDIQRTVDTAFAKVEAEGTERASILLRSGHLPETVDEVLKLLAERGEAAAIFVRSGELVHPYIAERRGFHGAAVQSLELAPLSTSALQYELGQLVQFKRQMKGKNNSVRIVVVDCPEKIASTVLQVPHKWGPLPRLDVIASVPLYLGDGRLLATSGYHVNYAAWLSVPAGIVVPQRPTRDQCMSALARVREWIAEFPFDGPVSEAVMLSALLTAGLRPSLAAAPGYAIDAPEFGVGKSTASTLICVVGSGRSPAVIQFHAEAEELRKVIDAAQIAGAAALVFDNVPPEVRVTSDALAQLLTEPERQPRELGVSRLHTVPCSQLVLLTGCNMQIADDLTRRLLTCRLEPITDPLIRQFKRPALIEEAKQRRAELLSDLFTIVAGGGHGAAAPPPLVGYPQWCALVQHPLVALGVADPVESVRGLQVADPAREALSHALDYWHQLHGNRWLRVRELLAAERTWTKEEELPIYWALMEVLRDECGTEKDGNGSTPNRRKLGHWLKARRGRWAARGLMLEWRPTSAGNPAQWRVVERGRCATVPQDLTVVDSTERRANQIKEGENGDLHRDAPRGEQLIPVEPLPPREGDEEDEL